MPVSGSEAIAKQPTIEEEMGKFKGFSVQDGEVSDGKSGSAADIRAAAEETERRAGEVNGRSHEENQKAGATSVQNAKPGEGKPAKVELTAEEEETAIQDATDKAGRQLTEDEADAAVGEALSDKLRAAEKAGRKKNGFQRIGELNRERRAAERRESATAAENADLRRRLEALERGEKPAPLTNGTQGDKKPSYGDKPDPTDTAKYQYGELDAKYIADLSRYETLKAIADEKAGEKTQQRSQQEAEAVAAFQEAKAAFEEAGIEQFDDFEDVVIATTDLKETDPGYWPLSQTMGELIFESDHGPAIAYHLASNPKEARDVFKLSAARQAIWFGKKEAELSTPAGSAASSDKDAENGEQTRQAEARTQRQLPQPRTSQVRESKAPLPLSKLNGARGNRVPSSATTDFATFEALANGTKK